MSDQGGIDARRFPRFKVAHFNKIRAKLDKHDQDHMIVTLGLGGCGFYGVENEASLTPPRRVFSIFEMEETLEKPLEIQGNLVYAKPIVVANKAVVFYGIEFIEAHRALIKPVIEKLEKLSEQGIIQPA